MKKIVIVLQEAASDIERGIDFYNAIEDGVGLYRIPRTSRVHLSEMQRVAGIVDGGGRGRPIRAAACRSDETVHRVPDRS